jgi:hypothetical protein
VASTAARNRRIRKARLRSQARRRLARAAHRARSGGNAGAGERAWADSATVERREADVPVARDGHARKRECRALTSATTAVTPPGVPPAPHFRAGAAADAKDLGASPPKRRHMQRRMRWRQRNATRRPGREKCAAGTRCAARRRPRSGLFDIVKKDAAPTVLGRRRVTMAVVLAEGEELDSNILQVGPRNRANSHAMQRRALLLRGLSRLALASCYYGNARSRRQHYRSPAARPMEGFPPAVAS